MYSIQRHPTKRVWSSSRLILEATQNGLLHEIYPEKLNKEDLLDRQHVVGTSS